jgi:hypothetical protein
MQTETNGNKDEEKSSIRRTVNSSSISLLTSQKAIINDWLCDRKPNSSDSAD